MSATMVLGTQQAMPIATMPMQAPGTMYVQVPAAMALGTQAAALTTMSPRSMVMGPQQSVKICARCGGVINGQYGTAGDAYYHPECMTCDRCGTLLLGAFSMQGGQKICPNCSPMSICTKCGQMITGQVLTTSDGLKFHPECFTCDRCNAPLPAQFHKRDGMRLCDNCVPKEVHNICAACGQPITGREVSTGNGMYYHPECLTCDSCGCALAGSFNMKNGRKLCDNCNVAPQKICAKCGAPIHGQAVTTKDGSNFHPECLTCDGCQKRLTGPFHLHEGRRYCDVCAPKQPDMKICARCNQPITGQYVTIGEGVFLHSECFTCAACNKGLSGIRLFRSATTGLAFCSEECHDRGPVATQSVVQIQTGRMGAASMVPAYPTNSMVAPQYSNALDLEPVPDEPVSPRKSHKDKKEKKEKKAPQTEKKNKKGLCCS